MSHFSIRSHSDMLVNNLSKSFNKMRLEARGKPILTMIETIRTKIMLLIVKKKEKADKWKGILCPKMKKKMDVNIKDLLRCVPSDAGGDKYQVECGPDSQHVVKRHKVGVPTQQQATPNLQEGAPTQQAAPTQLPTAPTHQQAALREKLPFKRKPTTVR
ncbi:hypothetical protein GOBAR_AA09956 [Gossypium barbadense]|uniref:Uncharacterized protein n=1 Tax=Gossypium barbadense TaxID=3634 RepID=A0A2P5Y527_GOSBA|nr:hypothetical protein GOBAR_AA09956 [Gossypium barbadense]